MATQEAFMGQSEYKYGFTTEVETDSLPKGLNEEIIVLSQPKRMNRSFFSIFV